MKKITLLIVLMLFCSWQLISAQGTITGKVTDSNDGSGLAGVSIVVKGTSVGALSDVAGNF